MKRIILWLLGIPVIAAVVMFALANPGPISVSFSPLPYVLAAPAFLVLFAALLAGFVLGGLIALLSGGKRRAEARRRAREIERLMRERDELQRRITALEAAKPPLDETTRRQLVVADN